MLVPVLVLTGVATVVLIPVAHPNTAQTWLDAIKVALSVGGGTGGLIL